MLPHRPAADARDGTGRHFPVPADGLPQVILPRFDADAVLDLIRRGTVTSTMMVTGMMTPRRRRPPVGRARSARCAGCCTAALRRRRPVPVGRRCAGRRARPGLRPARGRGGRSPCWTRTITRNRRRDTERVTSCGRPVGELRLRESGEVCVRSSMVVADYADPDGWCSLGDRGRFDERGYLHLAGRTDRMINTGYHVYPEEIEEAVRRIPGVAAVLVRGGAGPGPRPGRRRPPRRQRRPGTRHARRGRRRQLRSRLAGYKVPRRFVVSETLPATDSS